MSFTTEYVKEKAAKIVIKSAQGDLSVEFPAFLTSFTNSFSSNWNEEQVYGRQDPIGTFQSTTRTINIGFDIVSFDIETAKENMEKINTLTRMLYPSYSKSGNALVLSKAPLVTLRFGNLIQENDGALLGWIKSWSANPILDMGMFTPSAKGDTTATGTFLPKVYNATLDFAPQHRQDLAFNKGATGKPTKFPYDGG
tara:strand:+ start:2805 stop:3395 length:591 start_codon:yes stop_codon:yes gene_type:complete